MTSDKDAMLLSFPFLVVKKKIEFHCRVQWKSVILSWLLRAFVTKMATVQFSKNKKKKRWLPREGFEPGHIDIGATYDGINWFFFAVYLGLGVI